MSEANGWRPNIVTRPASAHGWVKRPDIGPGVWELPDGRLYQAEQGERILQTLVLPLPPPPEADGEGGSDVR